MLHRLADLLYSTFTYNVAWIFMILHCLHSSTCYLVSSVPRTPVIPEVHLRRYEMGNGRGAGCACGGGYNCCARSGASTEEERVGTFVSPGDTLAIISKEAKKDTNSRSIFLVQASPLLEDNCFRLPWAQRSRRPEINLATKLMSSSLKHVACTWFIYKRHRKQTEYRV